MIKFCRIVKPKTYPKNEHKINVNLIDSKALYILEKLRALNYVAYLVGGSVRDLLLQRRPKDFDISTSAKPEEIKSLFPSSLLIGRRFRLAHVRFGQKIIEVSTFRSGDIENEQLITEDNMWGNPEQDVLRRDFTINGLFYDSKREEIIDYVGGYPDIQKRYLRAIGQPYLRFKQDPVRMIRCLKFQARYDFTLDQEAKHALINCKKEIRKSAHARILEELLRMLESGSASSFFKLMTDYGLLRQLLPTLSEFLDMPAGSKVYNYLREIDKTFKESHQSQLERPILLACLIFPLLENRLQKSVTHSEKNCHLGFVYQEANKLIDLIFKTFFKLPRRLRIVTLDLLILQYRMTPLSKSKKKPLRIPQVAGLNLALQFLNIRARIEPALQETTCRWNQIFKKFNKIKKLPTTKKRRRKQHICKE